MADSSTQLALTQASRQLGWDEWTITSEPTGNLDRHPDSARQHALIRVAGHGLHKATIGASLATTFACHQLFHTHFPDHSASRGQLIQTDWGEVMVTDAIEATSLETLLGTALSLPQALVLWRQLKTLLTESRSDSNAAAWNAEWDVWCARFRSLDILKTRQSPVAITEHLAEIRSALWAEVTQPRKRWSNGDLTTQNVLRAPDGQFRIIDTEFAHETHFDFEDFVRLRLLSPTLQNHIILGPDFDPAISLAQRRFFQLRQRWLESATNSAAYLSRSLDQALNEYYSDAMPSSTSSANFESETAQLFFSTDGTWQEQHSVRQTYPRGKNQLIVFRIPDHTSIVRLDPLASARTFQLNTLAAIDHYGVSADCLAAATYANCGPSREAHRGQFRSLSDDPKLTLHLPSATHWLLVEINTSTDAEIRISG
jgi:hypothetical protein